MSLFRRNPPDQSPPDESTQDRARMKREAVYKLRRAKELKIRSSAVAADLNAHGEQNHYADRLREAMGFPT